MASTVTSVQVLAGRALPSKCYRFLRYMRECNFFYARKKCMAFVTSIFTEPINFTNFANLTKKQELFVAIMGRN